MWKLLAVTLLFTAALVRADTVYKSIDPDGKVKYSDKPPTADKLEKTLQLANLPSTPLPESTIRFREELQKSMKKRWSEKRAAPDTRQAVLFTAEWCGYCRQAKAYLAAKGFAYQEYDIDTPDGMQALIEVGGGRSVPLLLLNGKRVKGFSPSGYNALFGASQ